MERLPAECVNTYHYRSPTVWIVDIHLICIRLQQHWIAPPPVPVPQSHLVGGIETHQWAMVESLPEIIRIQIDNVGVWTTSILPWQCGEVGLSIPSRNPQIQPQLGSVYIVFTGIQYLMLLLNPFVEISSLITQ